LKNEGNDYFKIGNYIGARTQYNLALEICPEESKHERAIIFNNIAACCVKGVCNNKRK